LEKDEIVDGGKIADASDKARRKVIGLQAGQAVVIQGLAQWERGHLNGQSGVLVRRDLSGRWRVQLDAPLVDEAPRGAQVRREPGTGRLLVESALDNGLQHSSEPQWTVTVSPSALLAAGPALEAEETASSHLFQSSCVFLQRPASSPKSPWRSPKSLRHRLAVQRKPATSELPLFVRGSLRRELNAGTTHLAKVRHAGQKLAPPKHKGKAVMAEVSPLPPISSTHLLQRIVEMEQNWSNGATSTSAGQRWCQDAETYVFGSATDAIDGLCAHFQSPSERAFRPSFPSDVLTRAALKDLHGLMANLFPRCGLSEHDLLQNWLGDRAAVASPLLANGGETDDMM